jgi:hypothetical protein
MLEGFILHIMPGRSMVNVRKGKQGLAMANVPRQKIISRTVTVMQYRITAQYVWMIDANGMKTNHVAGIPVDRERGC